MDIGQILNQKRKDIALARVKSRMVSGGRNGLESLRRARNFTTLAKLQKMKADLRIIKRPEGSIEP